LLFSGSHGVRACRYFRAYRRYIASAYLKKVGFAKAAELDPNNVLKISVNSYATKITVYAQIYHPHLGNNFQLLYEVLVSFLDNSFPVGRKLKKVR
jgi:hypothetical protein